MSLTPNTRANTEQSVNHDQNLADASFSPRRTWGEYMQTKAREIGLGLSMATGAMGIGGGLVGTSNEARAGLVLGLQYDQARQDDGVARSAAQGGSVVGIDYLRDTGPSLATGTAFNRNGFGFVLTAGHVGSFSNFEVFTGWDSVNNRGLTFQPVRVDVFPGSSLGMALGSTPDVALFTLPSTIPGLGDIRFPDAPLGNGAVIHHGGFGSLGVYAGEMYGQDGKARAGTSIVDSSRSFINGANSDGYLTLRFNPFDPGSVRGTTGASGNPGQIFDPNLGPLTYGLVTQASGSTSGLTTQLVRTDRGNMEFHNWFDGRINEITSVPEPSSFALGLAAACAFAMGRFRLRRGGRAV